MPKLPAERCVHLPRVHVAGLAAQVVQDGTGPPALGLFLHVEGLKASDQTRMHRLNTESKERRGAWLSWYTNHPWHRINHPTFELWRPYLTPRHAGKRASLCLSTAWGCWLSTYLQQAEQPHQPRNGPCAGGRSARRQVSPRSSTPGHTDTQVLAPPHGCCSGGSATLQLGPCFGSS